MRARCPARLQQLIEAACRDLVVLDLGGVGHPMEVSCATVRRATGGWPSRDDRA